MHPTRPLLATLAAVSTLAVASALTPAVAGEQTPVTLTGALSATSVVKGKTVTLSGTLTGGDGAPRTVTVMRDLPGRDLAVATGALTGRVYSVGVSTDVFGTHRFYARVDSNGAETAAASPVVALAVVPGYTPAGKAGMWSHADPEIKARFDPCRSGGIDYKVNLTKKPANLTADKALQQIREALKRTTAATGLRYTYTGTTKAIPRLGMWGPEPGFNATLILGWATEKQVPELRGRTLGVGAYYATGSARDAMWIEAAAVAIDVTARLKPGFGKGPLLGQALLHEIGHTVGLGHVGAKTQIMYPNLTDKIARWGRGDLTGLAKKGLTQGCGPSGLPQDAALASREATRTVVHKVAD